METLSDKSKELISILKPHVTAFSAQLPLNYKHEDEVVVGGEVVSVFNANCFNSSNPVGIQNDFGVYLVLDDAIGQISIVIFQSEYQKLLKNVGKDSILGDIVLCEGQYGMMNKSTNFMTEVGAIIKHEKHPNKEEKPLVFCHNVQIIKMN